MRFLYVTKNWHFLTRETYAIYNIISLHKVSVKYAHYMAFSQLNGDLRMASYHVTSNVDSSLDRGENLTRARLILQKCTSMRILLNCIVLLMCRISTVCRFRTKAQFARMWIFLLKLRFLMIHHNIICLWLFRFSGTSQPLLIYYTYAV